MAIIMPRARRRSVAVAAEKAFETKHIPILGTSNDYRSAGAGFKEADPAQNECAHNALAKICFRNEQCA